jgi:hypothetical protein
MRRVPGLSMALNVASAPHHGGAGRQVSEKNNEVGTDDVTAKIRNRQFASMSAFLCGSGKVATRRLSVLTTKDVWFDFRVAPELRFVLWTALGTRLFRVSVYSPAACHSTLGHASQSSKLLLVALTIFADKPARVEVDIGVLQDRIAHGSDVAVIRAAASADDIQMGQ